MSHESVRSGSHLLQASRVSQLRLQLGADVALAVLTLAPEDEDPAPATLIQNPVEFSGRSARFGAGHLVRHIHLIHIAVFPGRQVPLGQVPGAACHVAEGKVLLQRCVQKKI